MEKNDFDDLIDELRVKYREHLSIEQFGQSDEYKIVRRGVGPDAPDEDIGDILYRERYEDGRISKQEIFVICDKWVTIFKERKKNRLR